MVIIYVLCRSILTETSKPTKKHERKPARKTKRKDLAGHEHEAVLDEFIESGGCFIGR